MEVFREGPEWQDDSDVTGCFLCHSQYTFFNRRHHCRKCGRVVCGSCSEQLVRYFPNTYVVNSDNTLGTLNSYEFYRTCDECADEINMIRRALFGSPGDSSSLVVGGSELASQNSSLIGRSDMSINDGENTSLANDNDSTTKYSTRTSTRMVESSTNSSIDVQSRDNHGHHYHYHGGQRNRDEDSDFNLCPVCSKNLLKNYIKDHKTSNSVSDISHDDFELYKEAHISNCLDSFDFNSDTNRLGSSGGSKAHARNKMLVYNIPPIPKPQFETIPNIDVGSFGTIQQVTSLSSMIPQIDNETEIAGSVNSNSTIQPSLEKQNIFKGIDNECVICLEDLKPGDKVGRLECLCVFHYKCIKDWFNKKGYGECPVHFVHQ